MAVSEPSAPFILASGTVIAYEDGRYIALAAHALQ
jgi:hypothetical protein